jgi:hypothetical protein
MKNNKLDTETKYFLRALIAVAVLLFSITILIWNLPRSYYSKREKRNLTAYPIFSVEGYFSGDFTSNLTLWFSDTVPFREDLLAIAGQLNALNGVYHEIRFNGDVDAVKDIGSEFSLEKEYGTNGYISIGDRTMSLFEGNRKQIEAYADVVNAYKQDMGEDVNVYAMIIPTAVEFYLPEEYSIYSNSEKEVIDFLYENLNGVIPIDVYSKLAAHTDEPIYFKTDHHWTQLGAYYASTAFAEVLGEAVQPLSDYESVTINGYIGSHYHYTNDSFILQYPEDFTYYIQPLPSVTYYYDGKTLESKGTIELIDLAYGSRDLYNIYFNGDLSHINIVTENKNGKRLCVIKDSFANALIPELVPYFEEIYVIDTRYFGMSAVEYMKQQNITDVLILNNVIFTNWNDYRNQLDIGRTTGNYS